MKTLLGKKIGMTQIFAEDGTVVPVTVIEAGPVAVTQIKTVETDGYDAVQVGFEDQKPQRVNKPLTGHFAKAGVETKKHLAEFKPEDGVSYELGQVITRTPQRTYDSRFQAQETCRCPGCRYIPIKSLQGQQGSWKNGKRHRNSSERSTRKDTC